MTLQPLEAADTGRVSTFLTALVGTMADETVETTDEDGNTISTPIGWKQASSVELEIFPIVWRWAVDQSVSIDVTRGAIYQNMKSLVVAFGGDHYQMIFDEANYQITIRKHG